MKRFLIAAAVASSALSAPVLATDVGVSISIGQPGFYGRLDIGGFPPPAVIYHEPVVIERVVVSRPPIYLRVPPGHAKHWGKHCHEYHACGERVYFVKDDWYTHEYAPRYRERHGDGRDNKRDDYRDDYRGQDKDKHDGRGKDHDKGQGHGRKD
jgi:hypothetical protein